MVIDVDVDVDDLTLRLCCIHIINYILCCVANLQFGSTCTCWRVRLSRTAHVVVCLCVFEFDVLVSCTSMVQLSDCEHRMCHCAFRSFAFTFTFSLSSLLLIHFSLFLSLSFFFSSSFSRLSSIDNGVSADGWEDSVWMRLLCAWALCCLSCEVEVNVVVLLYICSKHRERKKLAKKNRT